MEQRCKKLPNTRWELYNRGACAPKRESVQSTLSYEAYSVPEAEKRQLDQLLAEAVYTSGISFNFVSKAYAITIQTADSFAG